MALITLINQMTLLVCFCLCLRGMGGLHTMKTWRSCRSGKSAFYFLFPSFSFSRAFTAGHSLSMML